MRNKSLLITVFYLIIIAVVISSFIAFRRIIVEKESNIIELVADYTDIENLALNEGGNIIDILREYKKAGITSLAITENTLIDSEKEGLIVLSPGYMLKSNIYHPNRLYAYAKNTAYKSILIKELLLAFGKANITEKNNAIEVSASLDEIFLKGIGFSPIKINIIKDLGFRIIPRFKNSYTLDSNSIKQKLISAKSMFTFNTIIFDGEEVLGYPNYVKETSMILKEQNVKYGNIELAKQNGDSSMLKLSQTNTIKLHSISEDELRIMSKDAAINRFIRAAQDRNIRMLYIHTYPYPSKGRSFLDTNVALLDNLKSKLMNRGFYFGKASVPDKIKTIRINLVFLSLGVMASILLTLCYFTKVPDWLGLLALLLTLLSSLLLSILFIQKLFALFAAITFPVLAVASQHLAKQENSEQWVWYRAVLNVIYMVGITLAGGIIITGLLSDQSFMMGINKFTGVKISLILPAIIIAAYFFFRDKNGKININEIKSKLIEILNIRITILNASFMLLGLIAMGVLILRSGNFGLPILMFEKLFRGLLETSLIVRPRTKEFLIGYPLLLLGSIYYFKGGRKWMPLWAAVGSLALISIINTFCHIHSPFIITVIRSVYGLILGLLIGLTIYGAYNIYNLIIRKTNI